MSVKYGELSQLIGEIITSYRLEDTQCLRIVCESGRVFHMTLTDEGAGGNDSHAFFNDVCLIKDAKITAVREEDNDRDGARFVIECKWKSGLIDVVHNSNGYYGWSYDFVEVEPKG